MKEEIITYAKYQFEKSRDTFREARLLYEHNSLTGSVNRIYYSMFYSVTALMSLYGFSTSKHSGMLSNFNKEIANKGLISKELKDFYRNMFNKRQKGDYEIYKFNNKEVKEWLDRAEYFINAIEALMFKIIKEDETAEKDKKEDLKKKDGGFTLIELVMTIILIGILSIGLYQVVIWGVSDYVTNERYLHSNNSMTYAMATMRRNLENAAVLTAPLTIIGGVCPLNTNNYPNNGQGSNNFPITTACNDGSAPSCSNNTECPTNGNCTIPVPPSEVAFYQNVEINGVTTQQLVVFCVKSNINILYEEVTTNGTGTISYPVANNISGISF